jgi:hypothetical protein
VRLLGEIAVGVWPDRTSGMGSSENDIKVFRTARATPAVAVIGKDGPPTRRSTSQSFEKIDRDGVSAFRALMRV